MLYTSSPTEPLNVSICIIHLPDSALCLMPLLPLGIHPSVSLVLILLILQGQG